MTAFPWPTLYAAVHRITRCVFFSYICQGMLIAALINQCMLGSEELSYVPTVYIAPFPPLVPFVLVAFFGLHRRRRWAFTLLRFSSLGGLVVALAADLLFLAYALWLGPAFSVAPENSTNVLGETIMWLVIATLSGLISVWTGHRNNWFYAVSENNAWQ